MKYALACALSEIDGDDEATARVLSRSRQRSLNQRHAGRHLMQRLLAATETDGNWRIDADARGKPYLTPRDDVECPQISIAHTTGLAAVSICHLGPLGIDIELHDRGRNLAGIAETFFGPTEAVAVSTGNVQDFYRIWTVREAMGKATGEGLLTDRTDRVAAAPHEGTWVSEDGQWLLAHLLPRPGVSLALAILSTDIAQTRQWSLDSIHWPLS